MKTLHEAITAHAGNQAPALLKHLKTAELNDWDDLTKSRLNDFRDSLTRNVVLASAQTYLAVLKSIIVRYEEEAPITCTNFRQLLHNCKKDTPVKTHLTVQELAQFERVETQSDTEKYVLFCFPVGASTVMRISDTLEVSPENIQEGALSYVSIKTGVHATIPCSERARQYFL